MTSLRFMLIAAAAAAISACQTDPEPLGLVDSNDGGVPVADVGPTDPPDLGPPDLGVPDLGPPDTGPDAGRVDRTLTEFRPLGTLPSGNLVLSPTMDGFSAVGPRSFRTGFAERFTLRQSPTDTPVVRIGGQDGLFLLTQTHGTPLVAEIWVAPANGNDLTGVAVGLIAVIGAGREVQIPMVETPEDTIERDGLQWRRYAATVNERLYGNAAMIVQNEGNNQLWIGGPAVVAIQSDLVGTGARLRPAPAVVSRNLSPAWAPLAAHIRNWSDRQMKDNLKLPKPLRPLFGPGQAGPRR